MIAAGCTTVERAAMWCAQIGHESAGLRYLEEIADGSAYEGRRDLGNIHPGDGRRFKGSGPIQLTGRANFRAFTAWCRAHGHSDRDFEAQPHLVREQPRWGFLAASWYWTAARPQINGMADRRDLDGVTRAINGGLNGISDRRARYQRCLALGRRILPGKATPMTITHPMGPPSTIWRTSSPYGPRSGGFHAGTDFAAPHGTPIYAIADGLVIQGKDRAPGSVTGFGNWVWIDHQSTLGIDTIYGHMTHASILVKAGDYVRAGQQIATVGSEGQSSGPHLHFEVWGPPGRTGGVHQDPAAWLAKNITPAAPAAGELDSEGAEVAFTEHDRAMLQRIHHELTHRFGSRVENADGTESTFRDTLMGYILELDKKVEDIHVNMLPALWRGFTNLAKGPKK